MAKTITVKRPGIANGNITEVIIFNSLEPSSIATSLNEEGILLKAFLIIKIPKGNIPQVWIKIKPKWELVSPKSFNNLYKGIIREIPGIKIGKITNKKKKIF